MNFAISILQKPMASHDPSAIRNDHDTHAPVFSRIPPICILMLAFSGGGTRAAALSYGILKELARTPVSLWEAQPRILDEVDIISSVSGGSFAAAYYAHWGGPHFLGLRAALDRAVAREQYTEVPGVPWMLPRRVAIVVVNAHTD